MRLIAAFLIALATLAFVGCETSSTPDPTDAPSQTATVQPTPTGGPIVTTEPTETPVPTVTMEPTDTPDPVGPPDPFGTPEPTPTDGAVDEQYFGAQVACMSTQFAFENFDTDDAEMMEAEIADLIFALENAVALAELDTDPYMPVLTPLMETFAHVTGESSNPEAANQVAEECGDRGWATVVVPEELPGS